ncbi:MAG: hypothetical protein UT82_C0007G0027 [Parcubacteria group bacterium GW2011_GWB1_40_14]|nr:MAG: hypothetical protein UT82_C0007G0027 [Parcubacteria group bacterium GW2011_GWB1_40_14]
MRARIDDDGTISIIPETPADRLVVLQLKRHRGKQGNALVRVDRPVSVKREPNIVIGLWFDDNVQEPDKSNPEVKE